MLSIFPFGYIISIYPLARFSSCHGPFFLPLPAHKMLEKVYCIFSLKTAAPLAELVYQVGGISWASDLILSRIHNLVTTHSSKILLSEHLA